MWIREGIPFDAVDNSGARRVVEYPDAMGLDDFGARDWGLPPLDLAMLPDEPPPERRASGGISIGSEFSSESLRDVDGAPVDLGAALCAAGYAVVPGLAEIARLGSTDFEALTPAQRVDAVIAFERQRAWLDACQQQLLALISVWDDSEKHWSVEEVGCALGLSGQAAQSRLRNAERLCGQLPETWQALSDGVIAVGQATAITEASYELPDEVLAEYEARVLEHAPEQSLAETRRVAGRTALALDPAGAEQKRQRAMKERHVRIAPVEHGMAWLMALLPAADAAAIYSRLDATAKAAAADDPRSRDQLRADALVDGLLNGIAGDSPATHGRRPDVNVVVALSTLAGTDDEPGWIDGYGPITAQAAREIAHDPTGTWRRLITDPVSSRLLDYGTTRYRPPTHLAAHVIARDGQCGFPFCSHRADTADLDHIAPYPEGSTAAENLQPLHRRHHNAKTEAGWKASRDVDTETTTWTSPQGRVYRTRAPRRWSRPDVAEPDPPH